MQIYLTIQLTLLKYQASAFIKFRLDYLTRYFSPQVSTVFFLSNDITVKTEYQMQKKKSSKFPVCEHKYLVGTKVSEYLRD